MPIFFTPKPQVFIPPILLLELMCGKVCGKYAAHARLEGNWGHRGHGGPGHLDTPTDDCNTHPGMVCFRGAYFHIDDQDGNHYIYEIDRYDRGRDRWEAHWPD